MTRNYDKGPFDRALDELRLTASCASSRQAWLTAPEAKALLRRLNELTCDDCGEMCAGEVVRRVCDECNERSEG